MDKVAFIAVFLSHGYKLYGFGAQRKWTRKNREETSSTAPMMSSGTERSFGVSQILPLGSEPRSRGHQRTRARRSHENPLRHGSRWTRGQRTIMPGSVEDMSVYVSHA